MTSSTEKQIIVIYILPNISSNKDNQTIKSGHFIEYNIKNIFHEKPYPKQYNVVDKPDTDAGPRTFS